MVREVMTSKNLITAPEGMTMEEAKKILHEHRIEKLPVIDAEGRVKGLITFKDIKKSPSTPIVQRLRGAAPRRRGDRRGRGRPAAGRPSRRGKSRRGRDRHGPRALEERARHVAKTKTRHIRAPGDRWKHRDGAGGGGPHPERRGRDQSRDGTGRDLHDARRRGGRHPADHGDHGLRPGRVEGRGAAHRRRRREVLRRYGEGARRGRGLGDDRELIRRHRGEPRARSSSSRGARSRSTGAWDRSRR